MEAAEDSSSSPRKPTAPKIIIAGAPAAGKGTQCEIIKRELGVVHLSTGDMLRAAVNEQSELGMKAKSYIDEGKLVPDDLIINVVVERLQMPDCQSKGWLLDGFPRTRAQADALTRLGIEVDQFVLLDVPEEVLVERVTGRRTYSALLSFFFSCL
jgi:adenylate kinase